MVRRSLSNFEEQKNEIVALVHEFVASGKYIREYHDAFGPSKLNIDELQKIIESIEKRLRKVEINYYTFFETSYDSGIIINELFPVVNGIQQIDKVIETEFTYGTRVLKNRLVINEPKLYRELIEANFQTLILTIASTLELLVRLTETLVRKIILYDGKKLPYASTPLKLFILNWDKLVDLGYRENDNLYQCFDNHRGAFLNKYLDQINTLRNRFIHGYSENLKVNREPDLYLVTNHHTNSFQPGPGGINMDLVVERFTETIVTSLKNLITDNFELFVAELQNADEIPM